MRAGLTFHEAEEVEQRRLARLAIIQHRLVTLWHRIETLQATLDSCRNPESPRAKKISEIIAKSWQRYEAIEIEERELLKHRKGITNG